MTQNEDNLRSSVRVISEQRESTVAEPETEPLPTSRSSSEFLEATDGTANVIRISDYRDSVRFTDTPLQITDLYRGRAYSNPHLSRAIELLQEGRQALERAMHHLMEEDLIAADDTVQTFQASLAELFLCRGIGDGYGAAVAGLQFAFENLNGRPLEEKQLSTVHFVVRQLCIEPFMSVNQAYSMLAQLEDCGLVVTPQSVSDLFAEWS